MSPAPNRLALLRKRAGFTQAKLAYLAGIPSYTVSRHERGLGFGRAELIRYSAVLRVSVLALLVDPARLGLSEEGQC